MNKFVVMAVAALSLLMAGCKEQKAPIKVCIFPGDYPDPTILRDGNDYYMTHSNFTYYPGLLIWHSTDLLHWEPIARAVQGHDYSIYAPDLCKVNGKYYIYYPTSSGENFVVTADKMEGPWSEPVKLRVSGIDPGHAIDADGKRYLYTNDGHVAPLSDDGLSITGPNRKVYDPWQYPEEWETEGMWLESPKILKRGDWFYLVSAEGGTAGPVTSHMCVVARSKSVTGPWENSPHNPLVHTYSADEAWWSKGHGTLIDDPEGNWYIVYHAYRNGFHTLGRSTIIESVNWTKDGWPVLAEKDGAKWENGGLQDYDYLRHYENPLMWAKWEPGFDNGTLMTTTAVDTKYEITAKFNIKDGGRAGLYLFYNEDAYIGIQGTESEATFKNHQNKGVVTIGTQHDASSTLYIRILNDNNKVTISQSLDGQTWIDINKDVDVSTYHHNVYKGFFALRPAYFLDGDATLESFTYKPL
jgi:beta-xylosidase